MLVLKPADMAAAAHLAEAYAACVRYIFSNADFSSAGRRYQKPVENWRRFDALLEKLGRPLQHCKVVHIAGTNGKGTTSALCDAMLRASGKRVEYLPVRISIVFASVSEWTAN